MSRDELLVLRKTLTDYLEKGFIRVSSSPAGAPVLFAKKPGGGLRFCVDYRALNSITRKDRYPLPLIRETLTMIAKAKWLTKLDVILAFHKIRIAKGHEWKTAFRTRYGLYEWQIMPFVMTGSPATFQRYINWVLREYLDDFCSAYADDVLIYSSGSLRDHREKVSKVLAKLQAAGLPLDIDKCEFEARSVKYLGFIIEAGVGVKVDPDKVKAILEWEAPKTIKGVRGFIGFANFYRIFIEEFALKTAPLVQLTKKDAPFYWGEDQQRAFEKLKHEFITAPILAHFDSEKNTVLETDSSGYASGGVLSQYDEDGLLRPCAYFSRKHAPAECNYEIHDKELLAIIKCPLEWEAELRSVKSFTILTDHKNLEYFMKIQRLSERQIRWSLILARFPNMRIQFRPGSKADRPDALSRREQDMPNDIDERLEERSMQLIKPTMIKRGQVIRARINRVACTRIGERDDGGSERDSERDDDSNDNSDGPSEQRLFANESLQTQWAAARQSDQQYRKVSEALKRKDARLPPELGVKLSLSECDIDDRGFLRFRARVWIPDSEPLRTAIIQNSHDSHLSGHPGRDGTLALISRRFFWPGQSQMVRQFIRNCDVCGRSHLWRERKRGLLKPLPIPDRI